MGERNDAGEALLEFAKAFDLAIANSRFKKREEHLVTFRSSTTQTQIDYLLFKKEGVVACKDSIVIPSEQLSTEHRLLACDLLIKGAQGKANKVRPKSKIRWWNLSQEKAKTIVESLIPKLEAVSQHDDDVMWRLGAEKIRGLRQKVSAKQEAYTKLAACDSLEEKENFKAEYNLKKKDAKAAVKEAKDKAFDKLHQSLEEKGGERKLFRLEKSRECKSRDLGQVRCIKDEHGQVLVHQEDLKRRWWRYFSSLLNEAGGKYIETLSSDSFADGTAAAGTMGAGGRSIPPSVRKVKSEVLNRVPYEKPPFTLGEIKKAIPSHCFQRSEVRSFSFVVYDLTIAFILYYLANNYIQLLPNPFNYLAWPIYGFIQGCVLTGVWVIAHECGHHAFSDYQWLDDTVGLILHSCLLVPYFSWKYSHRRHHSNTGSLEKDEVFVPKTKDSLAWFSKYLNNPPGRLITLLVTLTLGWPLYLLFNVSGRRYERFSCHYDPASPIYSDRERLQIYISDVGILAVTYGLYRLAAANGVAWVLCVYGGPLVVVNGFLVLITFLQHTHPSLPHYDKSEWDWLRGALATVDRDYGFLNKVFHNITDTHVAHHLFSTMPHYHAMEATKAIKPILGEYYQFDGTSVFKAMWRETKECIYVEPDKNKGVFWYKNEL